MNWLDETALGFEAAGMLCFLVSMGFWVGNFRRSRKSGILDYSMFTLHPLFLICALFTGILLVSAVKYLRHIDAAGFRMSIGASMIFLSVLVWNTGFVTRKGLYLTGTPLNPLTVRRENGFLFFTPERHDIRAAKPIVYENTPENREKFADLLK